MTKEEALRQAEILQAYADGKTIQLKDKDSEPSDPMDGPTPWSRFIIRLVSLSL